MNICSAKKISVDCCLSDAKDGGPSHLGYDFYVRPEQETEMVEFIKLKIKQFGRPLLRVRVQDKKIKSNLFWTKSKIEDCIRYNEVS